MQHITDVDAESFRSAVIERSASVPVLVDYWADWCGPCQMQMPVLKKLVTDYDGRFVLAKINTDEQQELARAHNIRSLPTMHLYRNGEVQEEILGAQGEGTLRALLERYIVRPSDTLREQARSLFAEGREQQALEMLQNARQTEPDNHLLAVDYAWLCFRSGDTGEAERLLASLPHDVREQDEARRLQALLEFSSHAPAGVTLEQLEQAVASSPDSSEQRYQLGSVCVLRERYEQAAEAFMYILQHDRNYRDDAGRKALLALFSLLGDADERVPGWRRAMFNALH